MKEMEAWDSLALKFTSGNDKLVQRATITREEYEAVRDGKGRAYYTPAEMNEKERKKSLIEF